MVAENTDTRQHNQLQHNQDKQQHNQHDHPAAVPLPADAIERVGNRRWRRQVLWLGAAVLAAAVAFFYHQYSSLELNAAIGSAVQPPSTAAPAELVTSSKVWTATTALETTVEEALSSTLEPATAEPASEPAAESTSDIASEPASDSARVLSSEATLQATPEPTPEVASEAAPEDSAASRVDEILRLNERVFVFNATGTGKKRVHVRTVFTNQIASNDPVEDQHREVAVARNRNDSSSVDIEQLHSSSDSSGDNSDSGDRGNNSNGTNSNGTNSNENDSITNNTTAHHWLFGVFDGHAGVECGRRVAHELLPAIAENIAADTDTDRDTGADTAKHADTLIKADALTEADSAHQTSSSKHANSVRQANSANRAKVAATEVPDVPDVPNVPDVPGVSDNTDVADETDDSSQTSDTGAKMRRAALEASFANAFTNIDEDIVFGSVRQLKARLDSGTVTMADARAILMPALSGSCALVAAVDEEHGEVAVAIVGDSRAYIGRQAPGRAGWEAIALTADQTGDNPLEVARMRAEHPGEEDDVIRHGRVLGGLQPTRSFGDARYKWPVELQDQLFGAGQRDQGTAFARYGFRPPNLRTPPYVTAQPAVTFHRLSTHDRFLVLVSDGVHERMSDQLVVETVGAFFDGERTDAHAATQLIRAALSRAHDGRVYGSDFLEQVLAIPPPYSRNYRDDITVTVVELVHR